MSYTRFDTSNGLWEGLREGLCHHGEVIDIAIEDSQDDEHFAVAFAAIQLSEQLIECVVCLLQRYSDGSKDSCRVLEIHESEGPSACFCPQRILDQLDPTENSVSRTWRYRCVQVRGWDRGWVHDFMLGKSQIS